MVKKGWAGENERAKMLRSAGWFVVRNSGSIGAGDLICVKRLPTDTHYIVVEQVKVTALRKFYVYENTRSELRRLLHIFEQYGIKCLLVIKFGSKTWQMLDVGLIDVEKIKNVNDRGEVSYG